MDVVFIAICLPRVNGPVAIQAMKNFTVMTTRNQKICLMPASDGSAVLVSSWLGLVV